MHSLDSSNHGGAKVRFSSPGKACALHPVDALLVQPYRTRGGPWLLGFRAFDNIPRPSPGKTLRVTLAVWALRGGHHHMHQRKMLVPLSLVVPSLWTDTGSRWVHRPADAISCSQQCSYLLLLDLETISACVELQQARAFAQALAFCSPALCM